MVEAYRAPTKLIISGGWSYEFICDHEGVHPCFPAGVDYACVAGRLGERSYGP